MVNMFKWLPTEDFSVPHVHFGELALSKVVRLGPIYSKKVKILEVRKVDVNGEVEFLVGYFDLKIWNDVFLL